MLGLGSAFRRAYGEYFAAKSLQRNVRLRSIWGDEWAESSINTLWYPCNWRNVSDDELVLLIPSLASRRQNEGGADAAGPSPYLRRALTARLHWTVMALSSLAGDDRWSAEAVLEAIARSRVVTSIDLNGAWAGGAADCAEFYGDSPIPRRYTRGNAFSAAGADRDRWIFELTVLTCLDHLLLHSMSPGDISIGDDESDEPFGLPEVLLATIYASFNGAYIYRQFTSAHELFSVGAWLGHLLRGRAAIMPEFIADYIVDRFSRAASDDGSIYGRCGRLLHLHGDMAVGSKRLLAAARRVKRTGVPAIVKPAIRQPGHFGRMRLCTEKLSSDVARRINLNSFMAERRSCCT